MTWLPSWPSIVGAIIVIGLVEITFRIRRLRHHYADHHVARFFDLPVDKPRTPTRVCGLEGVARADIENDLYGHTDNRWGWLSRSSPTSPQVRTRRFGRSQRHLEWS